MKKLIPSLYDQEFGHTYYTVEENNGEWECNCRGLIKKIGEDKKRREHIYKYLECDHIKLAKSQSRYPDLIGG